MIHDKKWFPVVYMFAMTAVISSIVIGFTQLTSGRVEANEKLAFEKAILAVLPGLYDENEKVSSLQLHQRFTERVHEPDARSAGAYTMTDSGKVVAYALPIAGQGFWAPIRGVIGIRADGKTITGLAIYEQNETPGLGAEISHPQFRDTFKGKVMFVGAKPLQIKRPGSSLDSHSVHAVTGATQTSIRLEKLINDALNAWRKQIANKADGE